MKKVILSLAILFSSQFSLQANPGKVYQPVIKMLGETMDLQKGKTLKESRQQLLNSGFQDITYTLKPNLSNVFVLEGTDKGVTTTFELYYLPDGRIYEIVMSIESDKLGRESVGAKMAMQKIAFNNFSTAIFNELGSPEIKEMQWEEPYTQTDWEDDDKTAAALKGEKLFVFFGYVSSIYKDTEFRNEPSVYITLDPMLRVTMGVKDVELFKLLNAE